MDVFAELKLIISEFQEKMAEARGEMDETEKSGSSSFLGLGGAASTGLLAVGAAVVAATGVAVDLGLKFQTSTAQMAAAGNIPIKTAQAIGGAFLKTGGDTVYSGAQMEQAYGGVVGVLSTLKGYTDNATTATQFMKVATDLAEESGGSLNSTTADLAKVMQAYGINIKGAAGASVDMFNASRLTGQTVDTLTQGMTRLHSQMGIATPSLADASALLVDLTEHGETGRQAMSSLSSMFTGIVSPTAAVTKAQEDMGVSFINAKTGALDPMSQIIAELGPKIDGMGSAQATATLKALGFGAASLKLVSTIQAGPAAFNAASSAVNNTAAAHNALAAQQSTVEHRFEAVKVQLDNMATRIGIALLPMISTALRYFADFMTFLANHQQTIKLFADILVNVLTGGLIWLGQHWTQIWGDMKRIVTDFVGFFTAIPGEIQRNGLEPIVNFFTAMPGDIQRTCLQPIVNFFVALPGRIVNALSGIASTIGGAFSGIPNDIWNGVITPIWNFFSTLPASIVRLFTNLGGDIVKAITSEIPGGGIVGGALKKIGGIFQEGGFVPGSGPQLGILHGGEYVLTTSQVAALNQPGGAGTIGVGGGASGGAGGGDLVLQIDGQTFARMAGPAFRQWLNTAPGRNGVRLLVQ